jgi:hypothetical protein
MVHPANQKEPPAYPAQLRGGYGSESLSLSLFFLATCALGEFLVYFEEDEPLHFFSK